MDFGRIWYEIKRWARRTYKKIRKLFRKIVRWFRRYIRLLVRHTKAKDYSVLIYTILAVIVFVLVIICLFWFIIQILHTACFLLFL